MQLAEFFWQLQAQFSEGDPIRVALLAAQAAPFDDYPDALLLLLL